MNEADVSTMRAPQPQPIDLRTCHSLSRASTSTR
jgi:hypothetical protein